MVVVVRYTGPYLLGPNRYTYITNATKTSVTKFRQEKFTKSSLQSKQKMVNSSKRKPKQHMGIRATLPTGIRQPTGPASAQTSNATDPLLYAAAKSCSQIPPFNINTLSAFNRYQAMGELSSCESNAQFKCSTPAGSLLESQTEDVTDTNVTNPTSSGELQD